MRASWLYPEDTYQTKIKETAFFQVYEPDDKIMRRIVDALCIYKARRDFDKERRQSAGRDAKNQLSDLQIACGNLLSSLDKVLANPVLADESQAAGLPSFGIEVLNLQGAVTKLNEKPFLNLSRRTQDKIAREKLIASLRDTVAGLTISQQEQADIVLEILTIIDENIEPKLLQNMLSN